MSRGNRNRRKPEFETILRLADRADLLDDPKTTRLLQAAAATESPHLARQVERAVGMRTARRQAQPFDGTAPDVAGDRVELGTAVTGSRVAVAEDDLTQHLLAVGRSGAGKTTLLYNVMDQVSVPFWAFDLKQDYRHLVRERDDLLVLPWTAFKFNPLRPPAGVGPRRWAQVFAEIFGHATALLSGSKNYLMQAVVDLYRLYDRFDAVDGPYPSLHELQRFIEADRVNYVRKAANYRDTVLNRLAAMTLTAGTVFDCSAGHGVEDLLERDVVFEFDGLGRDLQNFLMEVLFAAVYEYRVAQDQRGGTLRHLFVLDEGKRVFSAYKERQDAAGLPAIDDLTAKMREFGEGLVVADQEATKLTDSLKANTGATVLLATGDARQFDAVADTLHLTERQRELAADLGVGEAVVQTGNHAPVPVDLAPYDLAKTVTDADLRDRQRAEWNSLEVAPRERPDAFLRAVAGEEDEEEISDDPKPSVDLSEDAERLLRDVVDNPFRPLTERYEVVGNAYRGNKAKQELVDAGLVEEAEIATGDARRKLLEVTEQGRDYLETEDVEVERRGRGGIVHRFWQHRVKERFEGQGWAAKLELFDADVYANTGGREVVAEIAMGNNEREVEHVEQHLAKGFDEVWVVCREAEVRDGLEERLEENGLLEERVAFRLFRDIGTGDDA